MPKHSPLTPSKNGKNAKIEKLGREKATKRKLGEDESGNAEESESVNRNKTSVPDTKPQTPMPVPTTLRSLYTVPEYYAGLSIYQLEISSTSKEEPLDHLIWPVDRKSHPEANKAADVSCKWNSNGIEHRKSDKSKAINIGQKTETKVPGKRKSEDNKNFDISTKEGSKFLVKRKRVDDVNDVYSDGRAKIARLKKPDPLLQQALEYPDHTEKYLNQLDRFLNVEMKSYKQGIVDFGTYNECIRDITMFMAENVEYLLKTEPGNVVKESASVGKSPTPSPTKCKVSSPTEKRKKFTYAPLKYP